MTDVRDEDGGVPRRRNGDAVDMRAEIESLRAALAARDEALRSAHERFEHDLLQARRELAQSREREEQLSERLSAVRAGASAAGPDIPRNRRRPKRPQSWRTRLLRTERPLDREVALIHDCDLFDADWYLAEYPDVANTSMDPAEHYLLHGAAEGRNPGPDFSTHQYLFDHPDVADSGENPLLHFLRSGGATGPR